ncbi:NADH-cytochrome b5 reductase-like [Zerene cesonia]|uniref:NADH-cytochrome b5 reductase-like n=1 Tax=Zerene cesonia TaxID=33412 RepID=UPI0018E5269A|nr:NADH-cytochrome b5 reductase-like [Zerene cesonia]
MMAPVEPSKEDCCNSGCNPCIFDVYEKQLKLYYKLKESNENVANNNYNGILQLEYTMFVVTGILNLYDSHKIIKFKRKVDGHKVWWNPGDHFFVLYKSKSIKCSRAYTPIKLKQHELHNFDFSVVVKKYPNGLVSNYLFNLDEGDLTYWRGPYDSYEIIPNKYDNIIMIAQGTGIAPFMSIIESILLNEDDITKIFLYFCCQSMETILFRDELYAYNSYWNFKYEVYLSQCFSEIDMKYEEPIIKRRLTFEDIKKLPQESNYQYLMCGSNAFMEYYKNLFLLQSVPSDYIVLF